MSLEDEHQRAQSRTTRPALTSTLLPNQVLVCIAAPIGSDTEILRYILQTPNKCSPVDSVLRIVDCMKGGAPNDRPAMIKLQREGIKSVKATHHSHCAIFAPGGSSGVPKKNSVYYLSVFDNRILREFKGHSGVINGISMVSLTILVESVEKRKS